MILPIKRPLETATFSLHAGINVIAFLRLFPRQLPFNGAGFSSSAGFPPALRFLAR